MPISDRDLQTIKSRYPQASRDELDQLSDGEIEILVKGQVLVKGQDVLKQCFNDDLKNLHEFYKEHNPNYHEEFNSYLVANNINIFEAVKNNSRVLVHILLDNGADPSGLDNRGYTNLTIACAAGNLEVAQVLISRGANVNDTLHAIISEANYVKSAVVRKRLCDSVKFLLANGANADLSMPYGNAPLSYALQYNLTDIANALLEHGCTPVSRLGQGSDPLKYRAVFSFLDGTHLVICTPGEKTIRPIVFMTNSLLWRLEDELGKLMSPKTSSQTVG